MVVGVYGGSFNPPHVGHAMVAAWLVWTARVEEVWLVPTWRHAFDKKLAPWGVRIAACEALAALVGPEVRVSTVEAELPEPSYTVQTLDTLRLRHPEHRFQLVVGADVVAQHAGWKDWPRIAAIRTRLSPSWSRTRRICRHRRRRSTCRLGKRCASMPATMGIGGLGSWRPPACGPAGARAPGPRPRPRPR